MEASDNFPPESLILLVDDSPIAQENLGKELIALGYTNLKKMKNGVEAQQFMQVQSAPDQPTVHLIFTDIHMPTMSGLAFLTWLRAQPAFADFPVIMLTSSADKSDLLEAIKQKVTQYLLKPYTADSLTAKMSATWKKHGQKYFEANPPKK